MFILRHDKHRFIISCNDRTILDAMQSHMDGKKVRLQDKIIIPLKSGPKILRYDEYGIQYGNGVKETIAALQKATKKRIENIAKIKSQYGSGHIKFDYDCKGEYKPMDHQKIMYNAMSYCDVASILADPGTCKTGAYLWSIDERIRKGQIKRCLVITLSDLKKNVFAEMKLQIPHLSGIILGDKSQYSKVLAKTYKNEKKNIDYDIYITNYESMFSVVDFFDEDFFQMVILDEAHRVGAPTSRQTKSILDKFESIPYKYIVTGSLHANNIMSFYMPFRFLGPDTVPYANYYEFRRQYMHTVDPDQRIWVPFKQSAESVKKIVGRVSVYFSKEDCLDLPPLINEKVSCNLGIKQGRLYREMKHDLISIIENMCSKCSRKGECNMSCSETLEAKNALVLSIKLQQITCGFYKNTKYEIDDNGKRTDISNIIMLDENPKLNLLIRVLNDIPYGKQTIIWSNFVTPINMISDRISKAFGEDSFLTCYGSQDTFDQVQAFKNTGRPFMIANPRKMGVGQNIQFSSYQVFFSSSYSWILRDQAIGRQHRQGQKEKVTVIDVFIEKTIDEVVLKALWDKHDLSISLSQLARVLKRP